MSKIYGGRYASSSDRVGVVDGNRIYRRRYTSTSDQIGVVEDGHATAVAGAAFLLLV
jgi:hypothetical protein